MTLSPFSFGNIQALGRRGEEGHRMPTPSERKGWKAARPCVSKETKPAKSDSLIEKDFCARPLKDVSIFAGFAGRRQAASRGVGQRRAWRAAILSRPLFW